MALKKYLFLPCLLVACLMAAGQEVAPIYHLQDLGPGWRLVTNVDSSITALETSVHRDGKQVYSRVLSLKPVELQGGVAPASEASIRRFISQYKPPQVPYTSPLKALELGTAKFNCLEFAEDIVDQAATNGISAEVIGIKLSGKLTGHACAGFPTADGGMLFFDSTPGSGRLSHAAHQAFVQVGQPYHRSDGGELGGGVGRLPVSEIVPVTPLKQSPLQAVTPSLPVALTPATTFSIQNEDRVQARGILYAQENALEVSDTQLQRWQKAIIERTAELKRQEDARKQAQEDHQAKLAAKALQENQQLAAEGDPYAQMRMGERYLTGEGVPKDPIQGRHYLELAASQGDSSALDELNRLNGQ